MLLLFLASVGHHARNGIAWLGDFVFKIRAELMPSVEKSGRPGF
jgi:hypothetical protein